MEERNHVLPGHCCAIRPGGWIVDVGVAARIGTIAKWTKQGLRTAALRGCFFLVANVARGCAHVRLQAKET
ncbi:hypothetical protein NDU88_002620 [Pleurodeles waltl]|uniref:Uncharacterized protein n=1 Tax=Pleurodeles waltl TaxID=8319 RepID=A0AAV7TLM2_PLEWA|nr:hypothetical protein NDU88_002620 [Pleurodeles waltl]